MSAGTMPDDEKTADDAHLDDLLGPAPEDEPEEAGEPAGGEPEPEAKAKPDPKHEPKTGDETAEPEKSDPDKPEAMEAGESGEDPLDAEAEKKRADGLLSEVKKLRDSLKAERLKQSQQFAPPPTQPPAQPPAEPKKTAQGIPVVVSEDGQSVYVDPDALTQTVEERARAIVDQARQPTPQQMAEMRERHVLGEFIAENPQVHQAAVQRAVQAEEYIGLKAQQIAMSQGIEYQTPEDILTVLRQTGADQEIATYFPDIAEMLPEFVAAAASGQPHWKRSIYQRIAAAQGPAGESAGDPAPKLRDVSQSPQSLARKGGGRTTSPTTEEREFESLEAEFRRDQFSFPEKKYQRLVELSRKLDKGYV